MWLQYRKSLNKQPGGLFIFRTFALGKGRHIQGGLNLQLIILNLKFSGNNLHSFSEPVKLRFRLAVLKFSQILRPNCS